MDHFESNLAHEVAVWVVKNGITGYNNLIYARVLLNLFNLSIAAIAMDQDINLTVVKLPSGIEYATQSW